MKVIITTEILRRMLTKFTKVINNDKVKTLADLINKHGADKFQNVDDLCYYLANIFHESYYLQKTEEVLTYTTTDRLRKVFPSYFKNKDEGYVKQYIRNPNGLANLVYGNRYGNKHANDGSKYKGRGLMMTTFKDNYEALNACIKRHNLPYDVINNPEILSTSFECAVLSSLCFYFSINVNDRISLKSVRHKVCGSSFALSSVEFIYKLIRKDLR